MDKQFIHSVIEYLFENAEELPIGKQSRLLIFSDLHMGNGKKNDDFRSNADFFSYVLTHYYYPQGFTLFLNGDIEELLKFSLEDIVSRWEAVYRIFDRFYQERRFYKLVGNHDATLFLKMEKFHRYPLHSVLKLNYYNDILFMFHGHQLSQAYHKYDDLVGLLLKYFALPLGIKNYSVSHNSKRQFTIEKLAYGYSVEKKIISLIGHTHRPLFESLSKSEILRYQIEHLCRHYGEYSREEQAAAAGKIKLYLNELEGSAKGKRPKGLRTQLYSSSVIVPCLFNSGSVIGKRGMTCLEVSDGKISLVYWFDLSRRRRRDFSYSEHVPQALGGTSYFRTILRQEQLDYIFTKINLLT